MKYHLSQGQKRSYKKSVIFSVFLCGTGIFIGMYLLFLTVITPKLPPSIFGAEPVKAKSEPVANTNKLYIPKLNLVLSINTGGVEALNDGVWHRYPDRGDPEKGGNFIIAGHRFSIAWTAKDVVKKSPFYHIDKLHEGDTFYVDFNGKRYEYQISKIYNVNDDDIEIEDPSPQDPHMTLYTCTLSGSSDGRVVVRAELVKDI